MKNMISKNGIIRTFNEDEFNLDLQSENTHSEDLLKAMSLCHCAVVRYNLMTNKSEYETERNEEIATLLFARNFGFSYNNPSAKLN